MFGFAILGSGRRVGGGGGSRKGFSPILVSVFFLGLLLLLLRTGSGSANGSKFNPRLPSCGGSIATTTEPLLFAAASEFLLRSACSWRSLSPMLRSWEKSGGWVCLAFFSAIVLAFAKGSADSSSFRRWEGIFKARARRSYQSDAFSFSVMC